MPASRRFEVTPENLDALWGTLEAELSDIGHPTPLTELAALGLDGGDTHFARLRSAGHTMQVYAGSYSLWGARSDAFTRVVINRFGRDSRGPIIRVCDYVIDNETGKLWTQPTDIRQDPQSGHWLKHESGAPIIYNESCDIEPSVAWNLDKSPDNDVPTYESRFRKLVERGVPNATKADFFRDINPDVIAPGMILSDSERQYLGQISTL